MPHDATARFRRDMLLGLAYYGGSDREELQARVRSIRVPGRTIAEVGAEWYRAEFLPGFMDLVPELAQAASWLRAGADRNEEVVRDILAALPPDLYTERIRNWESRDELAAAPGYRESTLAHDWASNQARHLVLMFGGDAVTDVCWAFRVGGLFRATPVIITALYPEGLRVQSDPECIPHIRGIRGGRGTLATTDVYRNIVAVGRSSLVSLLDLLC